MNALSKRLLVLTGTAPGKSGVGAILISQILEQIPRDRVHIVAIRARGDLQAQPQQASGVDVDLVRRYEPAFRPVGGSLGEVISGLADMNVGRSHRRKIIARSVESGANFEPDAIFAVLDCPTLIRMSAEVANKLNVPLYSFVMDDPDVFAHDLGYGRVLRRELKSSFDRTIRASERIAVAGESMRQIYFERWGKQGCILRQGQPYEPLNTSERPQLDNSIVRIGLAGSLTARDAFEQLVGALDRNRWNLAGKPVVLRIIGAHLKLLPSGPQHIEYFGWRSVPEMIRLSEECDVLYMPQSFDQALQALSRLSFPNKLCTYLPARRPIALHAPEYGSLHAFFDQYACGPTSSELCADDLLQKIEKTLTNVAWREKYQQAIERAYREEINLDRLRESALEFLS